MTDPVDAESFNVLLTTVRRFVRERLRPAEQRVEDDDAVPSALIEEIRELGLFGLSIAPEYGGLGLSAVQETEISLILGETSPAFRMVFMPNVGLGSRVIQAIGTPAQKERYLPGLADGSRRACFCLTEPDAGSDAASLRTNARWSDGSYVLNGTKRYISNAPRANLFIVMAKTSGRDGAEPGITAFVIEGGTPGLSVGPANRKLGQRGAPIADVVLDNVSVSPESVIGGQEGRGFKAAMSVLDAGRVSLGAAAVGMARRMIDEAGRYAQERKQFGQEIARFQLVQALIADSEMEYQAGRALTRAAAAALGQGGDDRLMAASAKLFTSEALSRIADRCLQVFGGAGYIADYGIERLYRDSRVLRIYEGTSQIMQLVIARETLKASGRAA